MQELVERERSAGKGVVVVGYPPSCGGALSGPEFDQLLNDYKLIADENKMVHFIDPRLDSVMANPCNVE